MASYRGPSVSISDKEQEVEQQPQDVDFGLGTSNTSAKRGKRKAKRAPMFWQHFDIELEEGPNGTMVVEECMRNKVE